MNNVEPKRQERELTVARLEKELGGAHANDAAILGLGIAELRQRVVRGETTPLSVWQAYTRKALACHAETNCLTELIAFREPAAGSLARSGPLAGIPVSIKDNFGIKGYDASMGFPSRCRKPVAEDSALIKLLRDAGAVLYVKTNVPTGMMSILSTNAVWGTTSNPHDVTRSPGGSSSGEGALIGGGGSRVGIGTDIGGSVRVPAHFCGIYSLRMSGRRFPRAWIDDASTPGFEGIPDVSSPLARTMEDLTFFIEGVMSMKPWEYCYDILPIPWRSALRGASSDGTSESSGRSPPEFPAGSGDFPGGSSGQSPVESYVESFAESASEIGTASPGESFTKLRRVGYMRSDGFLEPTPAVERALDITVSALRSAGVEVKEFALPQSGCVYDHAYAALSLADGFETVAKPLSRGERPDLVVAAVRGYAWLPKWLRTIVEWVLAKVFCQTALADELRQIGPCSTTRYYERVALREQLRRQFWDAWRAADIDVLLTPPFPSPAPPVHNLIPDSACNYTAIFNILDYPAGIIPVTTVDKHADQAPADLDVSQFNWITQSYFKVYDAEAMHGLPVGVQIVGPRLHDERVLDAMNYIDKLLKQKH